MTATDTMLDALDHAVTEVLETMFFAEPLGMCEEPAPAEEAEFSALLSYRGVASGRLSVHIAGGAARQLAADFLGSEPDSPPDDGEVSGVVRELANMICGAVLSRLHNDAVFELSAPVPCAGSESHPALCRCFDLGDGWIRICIE